MTYNFIHYFLEQYKIRTEMQNTIVRYKLLAYGSNISSIEPSCNIFEAICAAIKFDERNQIPCFDAAILSEKVFPTPSNMIFISHSHADKVRAEKIKQFIESKLSVRCFLDSHYWQNVDEAFHLLKEKFARQEDKVNCYWCQPCSVIFKNLYMLLSMALQKAIRDSLMFIFVPPPGKEENVDMKRITTESPWIAQELLTASLVPPHRLIKEQFEKVAAQRKTPIFKHEVTLDELLVGSVSDVIQHIKKISYNCHGRQN